MHYTREQFYRSKEWEAFRLVVIADRTDDDGYVHCAECGKPIINRYDLIIHHKQELSEANVNDATVSLNPDNVECICFRCHNRVHERFGFHKTSQFTNYKKHVYIVYGSPCAGKSTWVRSVATPDDLVVNLDSIWEMIGINDRYIKPAALRSVVFDLRDKLYEIIKYRSGRWHDAYVITGGALLADRERLQQRLAADDLILIDTDQQTCLNRVYQRYGNDEKLLNEWKNYVNDWFNQYQTPSPYGD